MHVINCVFMGQSNIVFFYKYALNIPKNYILHILFNGIPHALLSDNLS